MSTSEPAPDFSGFVAPPPTEEYLRRVASILDGLPDVTFTISGHFCSEAPCPRCDWTPGDLN